MGARRTPSAGSNEGNFVAEWFGHRVWPVVDTSAVAISNQRARACPFLTVATGQPSLCIKRAADWDEPYGVCTISSDSNGTRQDWIACPYRTLDQHFTLLANAVRTRYDVPPSIEIVLLPLTVLHRDEQRARIREGIRDGRRVFLFSASKLGGEIDLPETTASPGALVDMSVIEVTDVDASGKPMRYGKHLFYEIQTADFHGSPLHAAKMLKDLCPKDRNESGFHASLAARVEVAGTGVEGPNKANIFKRTIYQMLYKIELARHSDCAGFVIVLPVPVWDSWLRHLGQPTLTPIPNAAGIAALLATDEQLNEALASSNSAVYVFDIDRNSLESPRPLKILHQVICTSHALEHFAFEVAAARARDQGVIAAFRKALANRVDQGWNNRLVSVDRTPRTSPTITPPLFTDKKRQDVTETASGETTPTPKTRKR